jgi:hypothetical protein
MGGVAAAALAALLLLRRSRGAAAALQKGRQKFPPGGGGEFVIANPIHVSGGDGLGSGGGGGGGGVPSAAASGAPVVTPPLPLPEAASAPQTGARRGGLPTFTSPPSPPPLPPAEQEAELPNAVAGAADEDGQAQSPLQPPPPPPRHLLAAPPQPDWLSEPPPPPPPRPGGATPLGGSLHLRAPSVAAATPQPLAAAAPFSPQVAPISALASPADPHPPSTVLIANPLIRSLAAPSVVGRRVGGSIAAAISARLAEVGAGGGAPEK